MLPWSGPLSGKSDADFERDGEFGEFEQERKRSLFDEQEVKMERQGRETGRIHANTICNRNEYLNSKPGRESEAAQEMDSVTS